MSEPRRRPTTWLGLITAAGAVVCAATLCGFAGRFWWFFDLFSHFRLQYLLALACILPLMMLAKRFRAALVLGIFAAVNLAHVLPYYWPDDAMRSDVSPPATPPSKLLRAVSINVHTSNRQFDKVVQFILANQPDIVLLMEVNADWLTELTVLHALYPYRRTAPRSDNFGIALFSRLPFAASETVYLGPAEVPSVMAQFTVDAGRFTFLGTHPLPPVSAAYAERRNRQLDAVAQYLTSLSGPKIVMGDLNTTPWSYFFRRLLADAELRDPSTGFGFKTTWPVGQLLLRIPIDHCLVSPAISVVAKRVGTDVGSDHFPLVVDFAVAE